MTRSYSLIAAAILFSPSSGFARSVSAIFFQAPAGAPESVLMHCEKTTSELPLPRMNLSDRVKLPPGDLLLRFTTAPVPEGTPTPESAPSARIPQAWADVVLLFAHAPASKEFPFTVTALDISVGNFKPGELMVFNRSKNIVGGQVGTCKLRVNPGRSSKLDPPATGESDYPVKLGYVPEGETAAVPLANTVWRHQPDLRQLLFIVPDLGRGVPRVWSVSIRPPPKEG